MCLLFKRFVDFSTFYSFYKSSRCLHFLCDLTCVISPKESSCVGLFIITSLLWLNLQMVEVGFKWLKVNLKFVFHFLVLLLEFHLTQALNRLIVFLFDVVWIDYKFSYEICDCIGDRISGGRFIK
jgi:hypothetical protein